MIAVIIFSEGVSRPSAAALGERQPSGQQVTVDGVLLRDGARRVEADAGSEAGVGSPLTSSRV
jgi:hypothetical protein